MVIDHALYVAPLQQSSTARAPRARKKGASRCGLEDHGSQAPHSRRYAWPVAGRGGACCRHSGSRRDSHGARPPHAPLVPVHWAHPRRRRLSWAEGRKGRGQDGILDHRDRWTLARRRRIRSLTQALDRRTNLCLAQPFSTLGTRFRALRQDVAAFIRLAMIRIMLKRLVATPRRIQTLRMGSN
jgi:hypothetical protein